MCPASKLPFPAFLAFGSQCKMSTYSSCDTLSEIPFHFFHSWNSSPVIMVWLQELTHSGWWGREPYGDNVLWFYVVGIPGPDCWFHISFTRVRKTILCKPLLFQSLLQAFLGCFQRPIWMSWCTSEEIFCSIWFCFLANLSSIRVSTIGTQDSCLIFFPHITSKFLVSSKYVHLDVPQLL